MAKDYAGSFNSHLRDSELSHLLRQYWCSSLAPSPSPHPHPYPISPSPSSRPRPRPVLTPTRLALSSSRVLSSLLSPHPLRPPSFRPRPDLVHLLLVLPLASFTLKREAEAAIGQPFKPHQLERARDRHIGCKKTPVKMEGSGFGHPCQPSLTVSSHSLSSQSGMVQLALSFQQPWRLPCRCNNVLAKLAPTFPSLTHRPSAVARGRR
ncbi:hypothetical protein OG21DRAFT_1488292 [Imleria badia]|nr:hypothetical protein OG21DRAFT_1488292 [Imleria badia]